SSAAASAFQAGTPAAQQQSQQPAGGRRTIVRRRLHEPQTQTPRRSPAPPGAIARGNCMAKEDLVEFDGIVTEVLPDGNYRVKLDNNHVILAYAAGKMKKHRIRTLEGDRVTVEMSPYDLG